MNFIQLEIKAKKLIEEAIKELEERGELSRDTLIKLAEFELGVNTKGEIGWVGNNPNFIPKNTDFIRRKL